jgi:DnaJ-class molecular chaperone
MAPRNHYVVLGVVSTESAAGIRAAFRELARRLHPDRVGPDGAHAFRELTESYNVLRDPMQRKAYDEFLRSTPLERHVSLRRDSKEIRPSEGAMFDRFARNFTEVSLPKGERVAELTVDVAISEEEAGAGGTVRVGVPTFAPCTRCAAQGCDQCAWRGVRERERPVSIALPPMTGGGTTFVMPLQGLGIHNFYLRVRVRTDKAVEPPR